MTRTVRAQLAPLPVTMPQRVGDTLCGPAKPKPAGAHFIIAPYGWLAGINGETGVRDLSADVNVRFIDLLHHLRFAAMGTFDVGYNSWLGIADAVYSSIRVNHTLSRVPNEPNLDLTQKMFIGQAFVGYSFQPEKTLAIDLLVGTRIWSTRSTLGISGDIVNRARENSSSWADALGGLRVRWEPAPAWQINIAGDGGGGGSKGTGEGLGSVNYSFATHWSAFAGYRYLYENYRKNDFFFTGHMDGPLLGAAYRW
jgi:hypothetical protein